MEFTAKQIAQFVQGHIEAGDENISINNFSKIEEGEKGSISFLANPNTHTTYTIRNVLLY